MLDFDLNTQACVNKAGFSKMFTYYNVMIMITLTVYWSTHYTLLQLTSSFPSISTPFWRCCCIALTSPNFAATCNPSMVHYSVYIMEQIACHVLYMQLHYWTHHGEVLYCLSYNKWMTTPHIMGEDKITKHVEYTWLRYPNRILLTHGTFRLWGKVLVFYFFAYNHKCFCCENL